MTLAVLSLDPHMGILRAALRGAAAAAVGSMLANAIQMTWPYRTRLADLTVVVLVAAVVITFHLSLWYVFLIFLPLTFALLRMAREL